jgi:hypothetical protein
LEQLSEKCVPHQWSRIPENLLGSGKFGGVHLEPEWHVPPPWNFPSLYVQSLHLFRTGREAVKRYAASNVSAARHPKVSILQQLMTKFLPQGLQNPFQKGLRFDRNSFALFTTQSFAHFYGKHFQWSDNFFGPKWSKRRPPEGVSGWVGTQPRAQKPG